MLSLEEAKEWLRERASAGETCPCCDQFVKIYWRKLHSAMARALICMVREWEREPPAEDRWLHISGDWLNRKRNDHGDMAKLAFYGLTEEKPKGKEGKGRTSGYWRPTQAGIDFAHGRTEVPTHARVYDAKLLGLSETTGNIQAALGEDFDYIELMEA